jgi:iron complex outermembrane recepter protein
MQPRFYPSCFINVFFMVPLSLFAAEEPLETEELTEILVTAQKRGAESLLDIPIAISALDETALRRLGATAFADYAQSVPGLSFEALGPTSGSDDVTSGRNYVIRGVSAGFDGQETVAFYIDNAFVPPQDPKLLDIERVEVLKGPQGTLYGGNSMGGTIRVISKAPQLGQTEARASFEVGQTNSGGIAKQIGTTLNAPLWGDTAALRLSAFYLDSPGFIDRVFNGTPTTGYTQRFNNFNDEESYGARLAFRFEPNEQLSITPFIQHQNVRSGGNSVYLPELGDLVSVQGIATPQKETFTLTGLDIERQFTFGTLTSASAFYDSTARLRQDLSGIVGSFINSVDPNYPYFGFQGKIADRELGFERFTQEIRFASNLNRVVDFITGVFFLDERGTFGLLDIDSAPISAAEVFGFPVGSLLYRQDGITKQEQFAGFGELSYKPFQSLTITGGLRAFRAENSFDRDEDGVFNGGATSKTGTSSESGVTGKVLISYETAANLLFYATAAEGFRPGLANNPVPIEPCAADLDLLELTNAPESYSSDSLRSYEVGAKGTVLDRRISFNASAYLTDWTDIQTNVGLPTCGFSFSTNAGGAEIKGSELETTLRLTDRFTTRFGAAYVDATYTDVPPLLQLAGISIGDQLAFIPELSFSLNLDYHFALIDNLSGFATANYSWSDDRANFAGSGDAERLSSYDLAQVRFGIEAAQWSLEVFVENLFDERAVYSRRQEGDGNPALAGIAVAQPRTVGIKIERRW